MSWLCSAAAQADTVLEAIGGGPAPLGVGIHKKLDEDPPMDGNSGTIADDWRLMAGGPFSGECHNQANFMNLAVQLVGVPGGTVHTIKASTDSNPLGDYETRTAAELAITEDLDGDGLPGESDEVLRLVFDFDPPTGNWNNFEGTLDVAGKFYAVWPSYVAPSACEMLQTLLRPGTQGGEGAKQYWFYARPDGSIYHHPTEVPGPPGCP